MKPSPDRSEPGEIKPGDRVRFVDPFLEVESSGTVAGRGHPFLNGDQYFLVVVEDGNPRHIPPHQLTLATPERSLLPLPDLDTCLDDPHS